ncbi:hypothetical protein CANCADRAFT_20311, partial [Tortispora caseinolytica NRRL Y-17796]
ARLGTSYEVPIATRNSYVSARAEQDGLPNKPRPEDFQPIRVLGRGAYGKVLLVKEKTTNRLFAQKQLKKATMVVQKHTYEQTKNERAILESVRHPFIVKLYYALQDEAKLYLILEYAQGGELFTHLIQQRLFTESVASFYIAELVLALTHLHLNVGVVYRDLKPENCLLDRHGHLVLTDFGLSKIPEDGEQCGTILGTAEYIAPEVLLGEPYDSAVDWWSLGAVTFDLLTGSPPFTGNNYSKIIEKITKSKLVLPFHLSPYAKDFVTRLLRKDPRKRLGGCMPADLDKIKKHKFFRKVDFYALEHDYRSITPPIVPIITDPALAENFSDEFTSMPLISP